MTKGPAQVKMTPMLKQYFGVKRQHPDALVFFRMGDFFELFFEDARIAADILGIALTSRSRESDMPMAGVPVRSVDGYLQRLIQAGKTVVIFDQVQDPKEAKGIVDRAVTRIVTAGTILEDSLLEGGRPNYLAALALPERLLPDSPVGLAWIDLSTAQFEGATVKLADLPDEWSRLSPAELILPESLRDERPPPLAFLDVTGTKQAALTHRPDHQFDATVAERRVKEHFGIGDVGSFGLESGDPLLAAAGAILAYVHETQRGLIGHVCRLGRRQEVGRMLLDRAVCQALELLQTSRENRREGSLLWTIDRTRTAAGARLLREWILAPLTEVARIKERQEGVGELHEGEDLRVRLREALGSISDLERIGARLATSRTSPRDLAQLRDTLRCLPNLRELLREVVAPVLRDLGAQLVAPDGLPDLLERALVEAPPLNLKDGGYIEKGYSTELDRLRDLRFNSKNTILELQQREAKQSGIPNLKIGFNSVFGYYIEVTHAQKSRVPEHFIRKQTLKNAERYITPELKEYETEALLAEERSRKLEQELFEQVRVDAAASIRELQQLAGSLARLDALASLAEASREHQFIRPEIDNTRDLDIHEGRHPVLSVTLGRDAFVPNDCLLEGDGQTFALLTGPNMAGKSTYLRQTALLVLLAQIGCFIPATRARIGVVDKIFTRVGASDDLVRGASTFMVEMTETANILHHATDRSLVILDEIGRGTGTFDGLSLSRALAEHFAERVRARVLFATHYHQLTQIAEEIPTAKNLCVAVREWGEEIIFLHRIRPGGTDRSYGIHVARLAGLPPSVLERAEEVLAELELLSPELQLKTSRERLPTPDQQAKDEKSTADHESLIRKLRRADIDHMTPLEALNFLARLRTEAETTKKPRSKRKSDPEGPSLFEMRGAGG